MTDEVKSGDEKKLIPASVQFSDGAILQRQPNGQWKLTGLKHENQKDYISEWPANVTVECNGTLSMALPSGRLVRLRPEESIVPFEKMCSDKERKIVKQDIGKWTPHSSKDDGKSNVYHPVGLWGFDEADGKNTYVDSGGRTVQNWTTPNDNGLTYGRKQIVDRSRQIVERAMSFQGNSVGVWMHVQGANGEQVPIYGVKEITARRQPDGSWLTTYDTMFGKIVAQVNKDGTVASLNMDAYAPSGEGTNWHPEGKINTTSSSSTYSDCGSRPANHRVVPGRRIFRRR